MSTLAKIIWIFLTIQWTLILAAEAQNVHFDFPSSDDDDDIELLGDTHLSESGQGIELTKSRLHDNFNWSVGWAVYKRPVEIWSKSSGALASFQSYFQFKLYRGTQTKMDYYADGLAFFMAPLGSQPPQNGSGMWLGLFNSTTNGKSSTQKVAIEFDTFRNTIIDKFFGVNPHDPDDNHVGLDINNITSVKTVSLSQRLNSDQSWEVWIDYDGQLKRLQVFMAQNRSNFTSPRPQHPTLTYSLNLSDFLPEKVTIGFSASTGLSNQMHNLISWNFSSQNSWNHDKGRLSVIIISLVVVFGAVVAVILTISAAFHKLNNKKRVLLDIDLNNPDTNVLKSDGVLESVDEDKSPNRSPRVYSYDELSRATASFSQDLLLGQGGFGRVYKGSLEDGEIVAVKRIYQNSQEGLKQYESEIATIDNLSHPNLVPLWGWCHDRNGELLLVYQYMSNGSLDKYLFAGEARIRPLSWNERFSIVCNLASVLHHLHVESSPRILHRDIKSSNIMLDCNFVARLGDFGLARLMEHDNTSRYTKPGGTMGYIAPECFQTLRASSESDVFSFGAVALEIACGRPAFDRDLTFCNMSLVNWVWSLHEMGHILDAADKLLDKERDGAQIERLMLVGLWCSIHDYRQRPRMQLVLEALKFEAEVPMLPCRIPGEPH
ncbi:hypothetical protein SUGI_0890560 [Cryptomeria japonica]|uniref:L-type lectin-domain containing receptor kinase IX.1-like n=1 Tax=Cryptomeria japonica TaxID=3369 RepID=UPI002414C03D|nr:L-type lectin-domain containing receptor kinase IX.1-like [Cryptomeria japonica]GLJ42926.1 hypothetical protein SUGI_0890560 [Cryptomeria japonica]